MNQECFALLDDRDASDTLPRSRLYTGYLGQLACKQAEELPATLDAMQQALAQGQHAVGLFAYELGEDLQQIGTQREARTLSQVLLFQHCARLSADEVGAWLAAGEQAQRPAGIARVRANVTKGEFTAAIARIRAYIQNGDTYQINYTYRLRFDAYGSLFGLYARLRQRQPVPYGALIALPDGEAVLSLSPELFVRHERGELVAQPMKGTAAAGRDDEQDAVRSKELASDPKNRAENLMIVDLLRNDLGRIAEVGSVQTPRLFEVKRYANLLQMTSTVHARLRPELSLAEVFAAIYPCGSITGAPKRRTMQIIRELEPEPRGWYTGAIGWFEAPSGSQHVGDFCLSVPIRTLTLQAPDADGLRAGEMGVGAGIVYDSVAQEEYEECRIKARFLTGLPHEFELFETMHANHRDGCRHLERHLYRLRSSADYFGFAYDEEKIRAALDRLCSDLPPELPHRLRLALQQNGESTLQCQPLTALPNSVQILLAEQPVDLDALFLRHKTTLRASYDAAWRAAEQQGAFDMLFCNRHGELSEGARSNLFVKLAGRWFTPPLAAGVLPGVMRAVLLDDPQWNAIERTLTIDDLCNAQEIVVCNSLRGVMRASIAWAG